MTPFKSQLGPVGGSFLKIPFIKKNVDNASNSVIFANPIFPLKYNPSLIALPANPALFENFIPRKKFEALFDFDKDGVFEQVEVDSVQIPSIYEGQTVYVLLKPVINHRHELTAVIVIVKRMISFWEILGPSTFTSFIAIMIVIIFAAVLVARSLSRPFYRLASAAHRMGQGDLQTRVEVSGTEEQRVLSYAFNQLAGQIQSQVVQLQQKTAELQEANRELAQTHGFLQNILSNINTGVLSVDADLRISHLNQFGVKLFGVTDFEKRDMEQMIRCKSFVNLVRYSLEQGVSVAQQEIQFERSGVELVQLQVSTVPLFENGELAGLVITFHDLTAIRQLEEQVRRQDRLAALGRMAAGVAHEIRNPLGIIRGSAELLYKRVPPESTEQELSQFIVEEVNRLSRVVTDFLTFSRPPEPVIAEIDVSTLFQNAIGYTENQDEWTHYPIEIDLQPNLPDIAADEKLCRQVFLNLIINARDSMPQGGTITLRAYRISERHVAMEVIDKGMGIQSEQMDRIFDPFYTSKEGGTGLGLSLVHQIITNQGGKIEVDSQPGEGSVFRLIINTYTSYCGFF